MIAALLAGSAQADSYLYDMGSRDSHLEEGFRAATAGSVYSEQAGFGGERPGGMRSSVRAYRKPSSGEEGPPIRANAVTEDAVIGSRENRFLLKVPPGRYRLYIASHFRGASQWASSLF
ncbi:MAG: hypothetical protein IT210_08620 [Armatimonadetes bacterium]|nr:hypothetical protein [Armatimonadota bacterium]